MNHVGTKILKTRRLILRPFTMEDAEAMYRNWASDPEVTKYLTWPTHGDVGISRMVLESWVNEYQSKDYYQWAIVFEGAPIGSIAAVSVSDTDEKVEIGYCIGRKWWHKGIVSEALSAVILFFFEEVGINRIEAKHDANNPHSGGVMRKCGMKYEGTLRQANRNNQGICDSCVYGILRSEYFGERNEMES